MVLFLASSLQTVEYDHDVDFSRYKTWSWQAGVSDPSNPVVEKRIREALAKGLAAQGLSKVDSDARLLVKYQAARTTRIEILPLESRCGAPPTGIRDGETGAVVIDLLDAASGKVVWRGHAVGALRYGPIEVMTQIDAAVAELLARFPPRQ